MIRTISLAVLLCALVPLPASAQDDYFPEGSDWELTLNGSGSNDRDFDVGSFGFSGGIGYYLSDNLQLMLRQSVSYFDSDSTDSENISSTRAALDYHFDLGRVRPFIGANFGGVYGDAVEETFAAAPEAGAKWYLRPGAFVMLMGEYQFFFKDVDDADDRFDDGQFVYTLGLGFNW